MEDIETHEENKDVGMVFGAKKGADQPRDSKQLPGMGVENEDHPIKVGE